MSETQPTNGIEHTNGHTPDSGVGMLAGIDLQKTYGRRRVVDDVSLNVRKGEVVGLLGANGAGKTTTFYMLVGLEPTETGKITLNGRDVTILPVISGPGSGLAICRRSRRSFAN